MMRTRKSGPARRSAKTRHAPRFARQSPDTRRQALIDATIESLKQSGYEGLSVRRIAERAGVSLGLINHHFPSIDALIAAAYRDFNRLLIETVNRAIDRVPASPRARLGAFLQASFSAPTLDRDVLTMWVVFWGIHRHSEDLQQAHRESYGEYLQLVRGLLTDLARERDEKPFDPRLAAIGLMAMVDGLWLEWCLDATSFKPREAVALCESWIDHLPPG